MSKQANNSMNISKQSHMLSARYHTGSGSRDFVYSLEKNILISIIFKNGSSSLENWVDGEHGRGFVWTDWQSADALIDANNPVLITILRDPVQRLISTVDMLTHQYKQQGLSITYENFRNLEFTADPHLMPQSCFVPLLHQNRYQEYPANWTQDLAVYKHGWIDILHTYNIVDRVGANNKFFLMTADRNVMQDIAEFIAEPTMAGYWNNRKTEKEWSTPLETVFSDSYLDYVSTVYQSDRQLINSVEFENP